MEVTVKIEVFKKIIHTEDHHPKEDNLLTAEMGSVNELDVNSHEEASPKCPLFGGQYQPAKSVKKVDGPYPENQRQQPYIKEGVSE